MLRRLAAVLVTVPTITTPPMPCSALLLTRVCASSSNENSSSARRRPTSDATKRRTSHTPRRGHMSTRRRRHDDGSQSRTRKHATEQRQSQQQQQQPAPYRGPSRAVVDMATAAEAMLSTSFDDNNNNNDEDDRSSVHDQEDTATTTTKMGWDYAEVDRSTGKTALDALYDMDAARIRAVFERPLPRLPPDGSVYPDLFVGFAYYSYARRDAYRAVLARALGVSVAAVRLSVAWSGRFDVSRFGRVQKVCGVALTRALLPGNDNKDTSRESSNSSSSSNDDNDAHNDDATTTATAAMPSPLPRELQERVQQLVRTINAKRDEALLQLHMTQAGEPVAEVEFCAERREHRLLTRLRAYMDTHVLRRHLVVLLYGGNALQLPHDTTRATTADGVGDNAQQHVDAAAALLLRNAAETAEQHRLLTSVWLKPFYTRRVVPRMLSLGALATLLARAVVRGELDVSDAFATTSTSATLLTPALHDMLTTCIASSAADDKSDSSSNSNSASNSTQSTHSDSNTTQSADGDDDSLCSPRVLSSWSPSQQCAALQWLRLVRDAALLVAYTPDHTASTSSAAAVGDDGAVSWRMSSGSTLLPLFFVHGVYAGGADELRYLRSNVAAMNALVLHPNDVAMKQKMAARLQSGHRRLRLHEELARAQPGN